MHTWKTIKRIGGLALLLSPLVFVFFSFKNSKSCNQLVIDTYEIHAKINIPKVKYINCYYDAEAGIRISVYDLQQKLNLDKFNPVQRVEALDGLSGNYLLNNKELPDANSLYLASGSKWGRDWTFVFEESSGRLWAQLKY